MTRVLVAVDAGATDVGGAEHVVALLDEVLPAALASYVASTHVVPGGRVAVAASWAPASDDTGRDWSGAVAAAVPGADLLGAGARAAGEQHLARSAGRLVRYAGRAASEAEVTVADVLAAGVVDEVREVGAGPLAPETVVDLREWARPTWQAGRTVLLVQRARTGLVPFESRHQIACCADH